MLQHIPPYSLSSQIIAVKCRAKFHQVNYQISICGDLLFFDNSYFSVNVPLLFLFGEIKKINLLEFSKSQLLVHP
jgi:hypothetical protein